MDEAKRLKIVVADNHLQGVISLCQTLDYNGFKTYQAYNTPDAVELCKKEKPELLIVNIGMERMGGCDINKELPQQKILFIVSGENEKVAAKCKNNAGMIQKPVDPDELLKKVRRILIK